MKKDAHKWCSDQKEALHEERNLVQIKTLTHSPIAAMWNCNLNVCLHNGFVHRTDGVVICTVQIDRMMVSCFIWY